MKRIFLFALLVACSGNDDTVVDASVDQSQEATTNDAMVDAGKDATTDVAQDVTAQDATADASDATVVDVIVVKDAIADAPIVDAITIDVKNGCVDNSTCNAGDYCEKGTGNCNGVGTCVTPTKICPQFVNPVCGCDKKTYNNSCYAHKGLTSVAYAGACE